MDSEAIFDLLKREKAAIHSLGADRLGLFGSFARGEQKEDSDVDMVVEFRSGMKKYKNLVALLDLLEQTLQRKVDLLTWEGMASFVQREVKKDIKYVALVD